MTAPAPSLQKAVPKKIAVYTDARGWGGAEFYLTALVEGLAREGFEPHVYAADRRIVDPWVGDLRERGFTVTRFLPTKEYNPLAFFVGWKHLRGYEFVHFNKTDPRTILLDVVGARAAGARAVVVTEHLARAIESNFPLGRQIITAFVRFSNLFVDRTIAVSDLSRDMQIENYHVPPEKIVAILNGVDVPAFQLDHDRAGVRAELGIAGDDLVAVLVGRLTPRKGHTYALQSFAAVKKEVPSYKLLFVGWGEIEDEVRAEAESLGILDSVVFTGFRRDVPALLAASDLLILPSDNECLPLTILEAMATGLPVVATDVGGVSEEIDEGVTGFLIPTHDAAALAEATVKVLGSPDHGAAMGEAGRRKVAAEFSIDACIRAVVSVYEDVWRERTGGGEERAR
jgi:glycosyltransferase involved in cell wall biosynthesis